MADSVDNCLDGITMYIILSGLFSIAVTKYVSLRLIYALL